MGTTKPKGRGRPRLDPSGPPAGFLTIRASDTEREAYREAAERAEKPLSEWVREQLNKAAKREARQN
jgi:predicted HicB family RNase H-like nuclease